MPVSVVEATRKGYSNVSNQVAPPIIWCMIRNWCITTGYLRHLCYPIACQPTVHSTLTTQTVLGPCMTPDLRLILMNLCHMTIILPCQVDIRTIQSTIDQIANSYTGRRLMTWTAVLLVYRHCLCAFCLYVYAQIHCQNLRSINTTAC